MPSPTSSRCLFTPIGWLRVCATEQGISAIDFLEEAEEETGEMYDCLRSCLVQLQEYFDGKREAFSRLNMLLNGTSFQQNVWKAVAGVPFGKTVSYGSIAQTINRHSAYRAIGSAVGKNPLPVLIPCHRIVHTHAPSGGLGGSYAGGTWRKDWLLTHEKGVESGGGR